MKGEDMKKLIKIIKLMQILKSSGGGPVRGKVVKLFIFGAIFLLIAILLISIVIITLVANNYEQIYNWFLGFIRFVFGDSPENLWRKYLRQIIDAFINNLLQ